MNRFITALAILSLCTTLRAAELNVRDFGAKGDGATDDTAAFQKTLDEAGKTGDRVNVPGGRNAIRGHLSIPDSVCLART
jgi:polygalacturonase